jgi:hypothetical protein
MRKATKSCKVRELSPVRRLADVKKCYPGACFDTVFHCCAGLKSIPSVCEKGCDVNLEQLHVQPWVG